MSDGGRIICLVRDFFFDGTISGVSSDDESPEETDKLR